MRRILASVALAISLLSSQGFALAAANWPQGKVIRIVAPFAPGGVVDVVGRLVAERLSAELGQSVIVENRPGAGGVIGSAQVARAEPDGYTLLIGGLASHVIAPAISDQPPFDPMKDFTHIAYLGGPPIALIVSAKSEIRSIDDLLRAARKDDIAGYASSGVGTLGHILVEHFTSAQGVRIPHVPFNTAALYDIIAGRVPIGAFTFGSVLGQLQAGSVRMIAISSEKRHPDFPDAPTFKELGYDLIATTWMSLDAPKGLDPEIVARLNAATTKIMSQESMRARLQQDGIVPQPMTPDELAGFYKSELTYWTPVARAAVAKAR